MSRAMILTVGTSLFHSASWEPTGPLSDHPGYAPWLRGDFLTEPRRRDRDVPAQRLLERRLLAGDRGTAVDVEPWVSSLPEELQRGNFAAPELAMRFSAELATLLAMAERQGQSARELLTSYGDIWIPADPTRYGPEADERRSYVAAVHLQAYLNRIAGQEKAGLWEIPDLSNTEHKPLLAALAVLRGKALNLEEQYRHIDIVLTGGFKLYGYVLSPLATGGGPSGGRLVQLVYVHETGYSGGRREPLVVMDGRHVKIGAEQITLQEPPWGAG